MSFKRLQVLFLSFFMLFLFSFLVQAGSSTFIVPYQSYTYDFWENPVSSPQPYEPQRQISGEKLGVGRFNDPRDMAVGPEGDLYILDTGNNRIIIIDDNYEVKRVVEEFENHEGFDSFNNPRGIDVTARGRVYVADRNNERIVILDQDGDFIDIIGYPEADVIGEDFRYRPAKVSATIDGRVYVVSDDVHEGILFFDEEGQFQGFFGAPEVSPSFWEYFWRALPDAISTDERRTRMGLLLPTEFTNLTVDERGFVYATGPTDGEEVKLLNTAGEDRLRREGFHPPSGDYGSSLLDEYGEYAYPGSRLIDVIARENGMYSVLDAERGRIFTYDRNGNLLYIFGGETHTKGTFRSVIALAENNGKIMVLDRTDSRITIFSPTEYSSLIHGAIEAYDNGFYDLAEQRWQRVLRMNANNDRAYSGVGRAHFRRDEFAEAMYHFRLGQNRSDFSRAFEYYRREVLIENFDIVLYMFFGFILFLLLIIKFKIHKYFGSLFEIMERKLIGEKAAAQSFAEETGIRKAGNTGQKGIILKGYLRLKEEIKSVLFSLNVIFHPAGGFWDLKNEGKGSTGAATIILFFTAVTYVFMRQYTGFIFNERDLTQLNLLIEFATILIPLFLWCGVNWALTTLMDGKGTFKDVYIMSCYALIPIFILNVPLTVISNYLTGEEAMFYFLILVFSLFWTGVLMFMGTMITHEYNLTITLLVIISILLGMVLTLFIGLLFFNVIEQFIGFVLEIYEEISFRM